MSITPTILGFMIRRGVEYDVRYHTQTESLAQAATVLNINTDTVARGVLLLGGTQIYLAVLPLTHVIDFDKLSKFVGCHLEPVAAKSLAHMFADCEVGAIPPLGEAFNIDTIYDESLLHLAKVVFEPGSRDCLVSVGQDDFQKLISTSKVYHFAQPVLNLAPPSPTKAYEIVLPEAVDIDAAIAKFTPMGEVKNILDEIYELPMLPEHVRKIIEIKNNPKATVEQLASVVEVDPSLATQVLRYARSPFFAYKGKINNLQDAITRVLGFEMVINLALGLAALKPFRIPPDGPLGLHAFWQHASYCAVLCRKIANEIPKAKRPSPGTAYLAGLLHNFGFLLLGHLFQPEFFLLNRLVAANPGVPITAIEAHILGRSTSDDTMELGHTCLGAYLMAHWGMPDEIVVAIREHHNEQYNGDEHIYANIVYVANAWLKEHELGDALTNEVPSEMLQKLGIDEATGSRITEEFMRDCAGFNASELVSSATA